MPELTGSDLYVAFKGTSLAGNQRNFDVSEEMGIVDASAGSDAARTYLTTLEDGTASLLLLLQTGGTAATSPAQLLEPGAEGTLEWGPEGTATGAPRRYVNAIVTELGESHPYDEVIELTAGFQFSGVVTRTVY